MTTLNASPHEAAALHDGRATAVLRRMEPQPNESAVFIGIAHSESDCAAVFGYHDDSGTKVWFQFPYGRVGDVISIDGRDFAIASIDVIRVFEMTRDEAMELGCERIDPYDTNPELPPGMPACWKNYQREGGWFAGDPIASFRSLWKSRHGEGSWATDHAWLIGLGRVEG